MFNHKRLIMMPFRGGFKIISVTEVREDSSHHPGTKIQIYVAFSFRRNSGPLS